MNGRPPEIPCVLMRSDRGVSASTLLLPNPAAPQLYSKAVRLPARFSTRAVQLFPRCSNRASEGTFATHIRTGTLVPGAPLTSHRPGWVWARVGRGCAAIRSSARRRQKSIKSAGFLHISAMRKCC